MRIYLVRHGDADAEVPEGLGDEARALTPKSRQVMAAHLGSLTERMTGLDLVLTSPLVRAVQTAQILALIQKYEGLLHAHRSLIPDMPVGALDSVIREQAGKNLVLVGHQPSMGAMAAHLLGIASFPKPVLPGTVIGIQGLDEGTSVPATLLFYAAPGQPVADSL